MGALNAVALTWTLISFLWILRKGAEGLVIAMAVPIRVGGLAPAEWLVPVALAVEAARSQGSPLSRTRVSSKPGLLTVSFGLLGGLYIATGLWSDSLQDWIASFATFALALMAGVALYLYGKRVGPARGWLVILITLLLVALTALGFELLGRPNEWLVPGFFDASGILDERLQDTSLRLSHPWIGFSTYLAGWLALLTVVSVGIPGPTYLRVLGILLGLTGLVLAASWGWILAAFAGALMVPASQATRSFGRRFALVIASLAFLALSYTQIAGIRGGTPSDNGRLELFKYALSLLLERPIFGWGPGTWRGSEYLAGGTHSILLTTGLEFGFLGILLYLSILANVIGAVSRTSNPAYRSLAFGVIACTIGGGLVQASLEGAFFGQLVFALIGFMVGTSRHQAVTGVAIESKRLTSSRPATAAACPRYLTAPSPGHGRGAHRQAHHRSP